MSTWQVIQGDCLDVMRGMPENSVDSIVTDPPYGLSFMGKDWDHGLPGECFWAEALRVAKPGAMLMAFGGTRTFHRLACAIEDAGWEIRDTVMWVYSQGFPKSLDISKAIDKAAGAEREVIGVVHPDYKTKNGTTFGGSVPLAEHWNALTAPATEAARLWDGWGTALKPAWEPIIVAMKPLDGTFGQNAERWEVAGLWIDGCRVGDNPGYKYVADRNGTTFHGQQGERIRQSAEKKGAEYIASSMGRWPANLIHDGSDEVVEGFPVTKSDASMRGERSGNIYGGGKGPSGPNTLRGHNDTGSAARFFKSCPYSQEDICERANPAIIASTPEIGRSEQRRFVYCPKASRAEREMGLEGMPEHRYDTSVQRASQALGEEGTNGRGSHTRPFALNHHPTVKPLALMRYLVRLTRTPTGGLVLDPFMGSGTTGMACVMEGRDFIGIELEESYCEISRRRIAAAAMQPMLVNV